MQQFDANRNIHLWGPGQYWFLSAKVVSEQKVAESYQ
jgi:hypothetical protein